MTLLLDYGGHVSAVSPATEIQTDAEASAFCWFTPPECLQLQLHPYVLVDIQHAHRQTNHLTHHGQATA